MFPNCLCFSNDNLECKTLTKWSLQLISKPSTDSSENIALCFKNFNCCIRKWLLKFFSETTFIFTLHILSTVVKNRDYFSGEYTTIHQNDGQFLTTDLSLIFVCIWIKYLITTQRDAHIQTRDICGCSFTSKCHILKGLCWGPCMVENKILINSRKR